MVQKMKPQLLKVVSSFLIMGIISLFSGSSEAFIGGDPTFALRPGLARIGIEGLLLSCTGTMVSSKHLLTAAHCVTDESQALFDFNERYEAPFNEVIDVGLEDGSLMRQRVVVKAVHVFPAHYFNGNPAPFRRVPEKLALIQIFEVGDIAIIELQDPVVGPTQFPKILFQKNQDGKSVTVGGFGMKNPEDRDFSGSYYTGGKAKLGPLRHASSHSGLITLYPVLEKESPISAEIFNLGSEVTYLGAGDSGGGIFIQTGRDHFVVGVNHAGYFGDGSRLKLDPQTGKVLERSKEEMGELLGFGHVFLSSNTKLLNWVSAIVPHERIVVEK